MGARPSGFKAAETVPAAPAVEWSAQQQAIFDWFYTPMGERRVGQVASTPNLIVRARAGCLAADTQIPVNRAGQGWTISIRELATKFNGHKFIVSRNDGRTTVARGWDLRLPTFVQREVNGVIRLGVVKAAWVSGIKETFTLTTDSGRSIRATGEHPFKTADGWRRLDELTLNQLVLVRGEQSKPCSQSKTTYSDESGMWNHPYAVVRPPDKTHPAGTARVSTHRLVVEAHHNQVEFQQFLWRIRSDHVEGLVFLDPQQWAVHHRDRDTRHNSIDNLEVLSHVEHHRLHGLDDAMSNVLFKAKYEQVVTIVPFGPEETYDIEVEDEPHNFIANGFVVHNTGKTTVIVEGINRAPESRILACAFNKGIQQALSAKIQNGNAEVKTLHALGYQMIRRQWRGMPTATGSVRADYLTDQVLADHEKAQGAKVPYPIRQLISRLHTKVREMVPVDPTPAVATHLAYRFNLCPDDNWPEPYCEEEFVVAYALAAVHFAATVEPRWDIGIDFADMLFLPLAWNLTSKDYELTVVDEAQDMTAAQLELALRVTEGRICIVGDDRQAVYGFRGADSDSLDRLKRDLQAEELPLNTTYRCGGSIVKRAQELVPDIVAGPNNPAGTVDECSTKEMLEQVKAGDFILSRLNAPLVSIALRLLREQRRTRMAGRDLGAGIQAILKKLKIQDWLPIAQVIDRVSQWERKTTTRLAARGQNTLIDQTKDQAEMLYALAEDSETAKELVSKCDWLFQDNPDASQIVCSSVHKAKGLEADRVFVLMDTFYRRGTSQEDRNIHYVALTRAKHHLTLVRG